MKRIAYIDNLPCAAMILVILLHCINPVITQPAYYQTASWDICILLNAFCRCGVPLFFMMSGCLLLNVSAKGTYRIRVSGTAYKGTSVVEIQQCCNYECGIFEREMYKI